MLYVFQEKTTKMNEILMKQKKLKFNGKTKRTQLKVSFNEKCDQIYNIVCCFVFLVIVFMFVHHRVCIEKKNTYHLEKKCTTGHKFNVFTARTVVVDVMLLILLVDRVKHHVRHQVVVSWSNI